MEAIFQDIRYAARALCSSPGFTSVILLSLALGIGANTAIFSLIDSVVLKSLPVSHPEQLLHLTMPQDDYFTNPIWEEIRDRQDVFSDVFAYGGAGFNLAQSGEIRMANSQYVAGSFFNTLDLQPALGRTFTPADDQRGCPGVVVLSNALWRRNYGGRPDVIGKAISLDNHPFEIVGVLRQGFTGVNPGSSIDLYVPICSVKIVRGELSTLDRRDNWWLHIIGRPKPGLSQAQITARLKALAPDVLKDTVPANWNKEQQDGYLERTFNVEAAANGVSNLRQTYQQPLTILMVITALVLVIVCANVANLLLARSASRQREIAVRVALGLSRGRLLRQLLSESLLLSLSGALLGLLLARWGARLPIRLLSSSSYYNQVFLDLAIDWRVLLFTSGVAILTGIFFAIAPAWRATRVDPQAAMKTNARGVIEGAKFGLGKILVVAQVALSFLLVVGAVLMLSTFLKLETVATGFERGNILLASVDIRNGRYSPPQSAAAFDQILEHLRVLPGVRFASSSELTPVSGSSWNELVQIEGYASKGGADTQVYMNRISDGFFDTFGQAFVAGRDFNTHDTFQSPKVAIVNETIVKRFLAGQNPLGKHYRVEKGNILGPWIEIVGVVKDAKYRSLREDAPPTAYVPLNQDQAFFYRTFEVRSAAASSTGLIPAIKSTIAEINPNVSFEFNTLAAQVNESVNRERLLATLSGFFGGLALLLAVIGLYGVMSYNVTRRRNEIGIRMALGADNVGVRRMILHEASILIASGLAIGLAASLATTRFIESFLYGMKSSDPMTIIIAAGLLATVATIAGYLPARRASRLDPMAALREE